MAFPAASAPGGEPVPPPADPEAIRACRSPSLVVAFDRELKDPGAYYRLLARAEQTTRTGRAPEDSVSGDEIKAKIGERLGRQL